MATSVSSDRVRECLNDADFPADKDALVDVALRNGCDDAAKALRAIPAVTYQGLSEVLASVTLDDDDLSDSERASARRTHTKPGLSEGDKDRGPTHPIVDELGENRGS